MGALQLKPGARLDALTVGGAAILGALFRAATNLPFDLVVTSGTDGAHSGPQDPHHRGDALDVRSQGLTPAEKSSVLALVMHDLATLTHHFGRNAALVETSDGLATALFFGFLEAPGTANEHFHFQVRKGSVVPPLRSES